jgi:hypothetical protein
MVMAISQRVPDFRALFDVAPVPFLVLTRGLTIVDALLQATFTRHDGIVGRFLFDVFPDNPDNPDATGSGNAIASFDRVVRFKRPDAQPLQRHDVRRPDGAFEERFWNSVNAPVLGDSGDVEWIVQRVEDVTEINGLNYHHVAAKTHAQEQRRIAYQLRACVECYQRLAEATIDYRTAAIVAGCIDELQFQIRVLEAGSYCQDFLPRQPSMPEEIVALRAKATRYRQLASNVHNERLTGEIARCASELEGRAQILDGCEAQLKGNRDWSPVHCASCMRASCLQRQRDLIEPWV